MGEIIRRAVGASLIAGICSAHAVGFDVQIGALRGESGAYLAPAHQVGSVRTTDAGGGLTRYLVGPYETRREAEEALRSLQAMGYRDAFVRGNGQRAEAAHPRPSSADRKDDLYGVPAELRSKVVYLDGVLHVKEGEAFTPLSRYPR